MGFIALAHFVPVNSHQKSAWAADLREETLRHVQFELNEIKFQQNNQAKSVATISDSDDDGEIRDTNFTNSPRIREHSCHSCPSQAFRSQKQQPAKRTTEAPKTKNQNKIRDTN